MIGMEKSMAKFDYKLLAIIGDQRGQVLNLLNILGINAYILKTGNTKISIYVLVNE
jgi:hypothetical protein